MLPDVTPPAWALFLVIMRLKMLLSASLALDLPVSDCDGFPPLSDIDLSFDFSTPLMMVIEAGKQGTTRACTLG